jgi:hypothetical protein
VGNSSELQPIWAVLVELSLPAVEGAGSGWCFGRANSRDRFEKIVRNALKSGQARIILVGEIRRATPLELFRLSRKKEHIRSVNRFLESGENFNCAIFY